MHSARHIAAAVKRRLGAGYSRAKGTWHLSTLRLRSRIGAGGRWEKVAGWRIKALDSADFYVQMKTMFIDEIYRFHASTEAPLVIDGGTNIGMSLLYFKSLAPRARIIGFEPDPDIFAVLDANVKANELQGIRLENVALGGSDATEAFQPDGVSGGKLREGDGLRVPVVRLSTFVEEPVDFMKLNIEGRELEVLTELENSGRLEMIREMVVEFHGEPGNEATLAALISLLGRNGFNILIHDFDDQTNPATKPPFEIRPDTRYFLLVYGVRAGAE